MRMEAIGNANLLGILHNQNEQQKAWLAKVIKLARDGDKDAFSAIQLLNSTMKAGKQCTDQQLKMIWSETMRNLIDESNNENNGAIGNVDQA